MVDLEQARDKLDGLLQQQRETFSQDPNRISPSDSYSPRRIKEAFLQTRDFSDIYQEAVERFSQPLTYDEEQILKGHLIGGLIHALSFAVLHAQLSSSQELLSPDRTLEFFQFLNPEAPRIDFPFGLSTLKDVSVPDGVTLPRGTLIQGEIQIQRIYEYTICRKTKYLDRKRAHLDNRKAELLSQIPRVLVAPRDNPLLIIGQRQGMEVRPLPLDRNDVTKHYKYVYQEYRTDKDSPTLHERVLAHAV